MNITISRYPHTPCDQRDDWPENLGEPGDRWESVIEPENRAWILFVAVDGSASFWPEREPSGAVKGEPVTVAD